MISATSVVPYTVLLQYCSGRLLFRFLMLDNDTEYFVEPRFAVSGGSWRDGGESSSLWRTRTSLGNSMGAEADWEIMPEDIIICKDPYGRDWQLGTGGFGSVRRCSSLPSALHLYCSNPGARSHLEILSRPGLSADE